MAIPLFLRTLPSHFFSAARLHLLQRYRLTHRNLETWPRVVYVDRQNSTRRMPQADHEGVLDILDFLQRSGRAETEHLILEQLSPEEQLAAVAGASVRLCMFSATLRVHCFQSSLIFQIMIGIHGNGLTHELWMPENSALIEVGRSSAAL